MPCIEVRGTVLHAHVIKLQTRDHVIMLFGSCCVLVPHFLGLLVGMRARSFLVACALHLVRNRTSLYWSLGKIGLCSPSQAACKVPYCVLQ